MRINITDENLGQLYFAEMSDDLVKLFKRVINDGISFAGSDYVFLAWSSSQLKEHGFWMYCDPEFGEPGVPTAQDIRREAGALSSIRIPAKYAARLGQCFSDTTSTIEIPDHQACAALA